MKLTKSQKLFAGILGIALTGLTADRLLLAPSAAKAGTDDAQLAPGALQAASNLEGRQAPSVNGTRTPFARELPARLRAVAAESAIDFEAVGDAFAVPSHWLPEDALQTLDSGEARSLADEFATRHTLNAVLAGATGDYAMIDGKAMRLGAMLDGFEVVEIASRRVTLERNGLRIELSLPRTP